MFTLLNKRLIKNFLTEKKNIFFLIIIFYFIFLFIGTLVFDDYGLAYDEDIQRAIGLSNYEYISNIFQEGKNEIIHPFYGVGFELPAIFLEKILNIKNIKDIYLFRHFFIFFTTFVGHITFFILLQKRFNSIYFSLFGSLVLIITPRFFAESFYNSKDIVFMHSFIICTFFGLKFLEKPNLLSSFLFALFTAWAINIRMVALLVPLIILYFVIIKYLRKEYHFPIFYNIFFYFIFLSIFTIFFWPYLWANPVKNLINVFFLFENHATFATNFYLGKYINAKVVDWYYLPLWILVTTPFYVLFFFILGFVKNVRRTTNRLLSINEKNNFNDLWRGKKELFNLIFVSFVFISIFLAIILKLPLYNGWRHFYFIYPFILIIALTEIKFAFIFYKKFKLILILFLFFGIIFQIKWMTISHPYQNVYFNFIAGSKPHLNYEVDYWGLSNKYVLNKILSSDKKKEIISISNISDTSLIFNLNLLNTSNKKRIIYKDISQNADYLIDNNYFFNQKNRGRRKILKDYYFFDQLYVGKTLVTTIYKKK